MEIFADESKTSTLKTIPVAHDEIKIYGREAISDIGSLSGRRVGISAGSIITKIFPLNCEYVGYNTNTEILTAVANGEVDYGICHASVAAEIIQRDDLGIVIKDASGGTVVPNQFYNVKGFYQNQGDWNLTAAPVAKPGVGSVKEGEFEASATVVAQFQ